ncbi:helix-turn-helix domain-containing protein [Streptomyces sp. NPDC057702]|uniref:helix-turn-helix domain-containing protein n=1 Tax=unclassified Streptomyces TaxID=2593676 RepID=UPI0036BFB9C5
MEPITAEPAPGQLASGHPDSAELTPGQPTPKPPAPGRPTPGQPAPEEPIPGQPLPRQPGSAEPRSGQPGGEVAGSAELAPEEPAAGPWLGPAAVRSFAGPFGSSAEPPSGRPVGPWAGELVPDLTPEQWPREALAVGSFTLTGGEWFGRHRHTAHQLAWAREGVLAVRALGSTWILPPSMALWLPAGLVHDTGATSPAALLRSLYFNPAQCPVNWTAPTVVAVSALLRELIGALADGSLGAGPRRRAEAVVFDQLRPVSVATVLAPVPRDPRAREVAEALRAHPADARALADWGTAVGASARTLARAFVADTGLSFGQWRTRLRLQAAMPLLASGAPVSAAARRVGYASTSAFVAAFRRVVGVPPRTYFAPATPPISP